MKDKVLERSIKSNKFLKFLCRNFDVDNVYVVGGFVRDSILGINSEDIDLVICGKDAKQYALELSDRVKGFFVELDRDNRIYRCVLEDKKTFVDITSIEGSIEKDLELRDLTINSIAVNLKTLEIIDPTLGMEDLKNNKLIRPYRLDNLLEDPIRLLRLFRFKSSFGFEVGKEVIEFVKVNAYHLKYVAKERITSELLKLFCGNFASNVLIDIDRCGILEYILPQMLKTKEVVPNLHHHLNLFEHSIETVRQIELYLKSSQVSKDILNHLEEPFCFGINRVGFLKFASFCHDIGKPLTWTIEPDSKRHRFIKHDIVGSEIIVPILKSLKFSQKSIKYIQSLIKHHIYPSSLGGNGDFSEKAKLRFYRKMGDNVIDVIILARADRLSARGVEITEDKINRNLCHLNNLLQEYFRIKDTLKPLPKLIDGNEIFKLLRLKSRKDLKRIIEALKEAQIVNEVVTKDEAIRFLEYNFASYNKS